LEELEIDEFFQPIEPVTIVDCGADPDPRKKEGQ